MTRNWKMNETCGNCMFYNPNKRVNNCEANIIATTQPSNYGCYMIQKSKKNNQ